MFFSALSSVFVALPIIGVRGLLLQHWPGGHINMRTSGCATWSESMGNAIRGATLHSWVAILLYDWLQQMGEEFMRQIIVVAVTKTASEESYSHTEEWRCWDAYWSRAHCAFKCIHSAGSAIAHDGSLLSPNVGNMLFYKIDLFMNLINGVCL